MTDGLKDKVAVVTGSGSGIGAAITHSFLGAGASVLATGRRAEKLGNLGSHGSLVTVAGDITEPDFADHLLVEQSTLLDVVILLLITRV